MSCTTSNYRFKLLIIVCTAPILSAVITASGSPDEGQNYSLTCAVRGDESLAGFDRQYLWENAIGSDVSRAPTLTFNPLRRSDAGVYRCFFTFSSPYLTGTRTVTATQNVVVNSKCHL